MWYILIILFNNEKNEMLPLAAAWRDMERIMLTDIHQIQKDKYCVIPLMFGI